MIRWLIFSSLFVSLAAQDFQWQEASYPEYSSSTRAQVIGYVNGAGAIDDLLGFSGLGWGLICEKGHHGLSVYESCVRGQQEGVTYDSLSLVSANYLYYRDATAMNTLYWGLGAGHSVLLPPDAACVARAFKVTPLIGYVYQRYAPIRIMVQCNLQVLRLCGTPDWLHRKYLFQPSLTCAVGFSLW